MSNEVEPETKRRRKSRWEVLPESQDHTLETMSQQHHIEQHPQMVKAPQVPVSSVPVGADCRIYVGSLHYEIKQEEVKVLFSSFGPIRSIDLSLEPGTQRSKGYCFIEYETPAAAEAAMAMNNFELAGRNVSRYQYA